MAGAGYKLFQTGDVLTAAQVNTYLMEQTVMVFDDAAARTTALSGVVSEGMLSYLKDTNAVEVYDGSSWVASDDPNAIQNSIVDAKGDLISASADNVPARLAVGNDGESIVADSSASVGLSYRADWAAGKNKVINGDFRINQRAFSSTSTNGIYTFDRWVTNSSGGSATWSAQTFTAGAAPVAGYEGINFIRLAASSQGAGTYVSLNQRIEDVRVFANQTFTVSFWAKASSGTPKVSAYIGQTFGSGGSAAVYTYGSAPTISTSWARYSITITAPSISGKTIGTSSFLDLGISASDAFNANLGAQDATIDIWGVQAEAGSVATAFQTATGTLPGELSLAQRYYYLAGEGSGKALGIGFNLNGSGAFTNIFFPVTMRIAPTLVSTTGTDYYAFDRDGATDTFNSFTIQRPSTTITAIFNDSQISGTSGQAGYMYTNNAAASVAFNAEL